MTPSTFIFAGNGRSEGINNNPTAVKRRRPHPVINQGPTLDLDIEEKCV